MCSGRTFPLCFLSCFIFRTLYHCVFSNSLICSRLWLFILCGLVRIWNTESSPGGRIEQVMRGGGGETMMMIQSAVNHELTTFKIIINKTSKDFLDPFACSQGCKRSQKHQPSAAQKGKWAASEPEFNTTHPLLVQIVSSRIKVLDWPNCVSILSFLHKQLKPRRTLITNLLGVNNNDKLQLLQLVGDEYERMKQH